MPSLVLFGRRTIFAGDDLRTMTAGAFLFRFIQLALALPILIEFGIGEYDQIKADNCHVSEDSDPKWFEENSFTVFFVYVCLAIVLAVAGMTACASKF
jgi:hypothetical protein